ncbi:MAG: hypothetical protein ACSLFA_09435 [Mycobacterium sp.]
MDANDFNTFINSLLDDLTPAPVPEDGADRRLCHLLESPRRTVDEPALLAVLAAAVTARNVFDHVIAQAVAASTPGLSHPTADRTRTGAPAIPHEAHHDRPTCRRIAQRFTAP